MTWEHVDEAALTRFISGEMSPAQAADVGRHLDDCPRCAAALSQLDPLLPIFAGVEDPEVPPDLAPAILEAAAAPGAIGPEPVIAAGMLMAASVLLLGWGAPGQILGLVATVAGAFGSIIVASTAALGNPLTIWMVAAGLLLVLSVVGVRRLEVRRRA